MTSERRYIIIIIIIIHFTSHYLRFQLDQLHGGPWLGDLRQRHVCRVSPAATSRRNYGFKSKPPPPPPRAPLPPRTTSLPLFISSSHPQLSLSLSPVLSSAVLWRILIRSHSHRLSHSHTHTSKCAQFIRARTHTHTHTHTPY